MTRKECLDAAAGCVLKDRQNEYGGPEDNFGRIATMWNGYLGTNSIKPWDVAAMMILLKMARARFNPKREDDWIDAAGYAACGIECATAQEEFDKALDEFQKKAMPAFASKAEGCEEPKFKRGDRVEVNAMTVRDLWEPATVVEVVDGACRVEFVDGYRQLRPLSCVRPVPKAEGCEELVQKDLHEDCEGCLYKTYADSHAEEHDAPQTKEELMERIKSVNPAIYGAHIE